MAFSLFRGIRRVSLIKIAQCLDPDPNLKYQKAKKRDKSPKKGSDHTGYSKREKDSKKSETMVMCKIPQEKIQEDPKQLSCVKSLKNRFKKF